MTNIPLYFCPLELNTLYLFFCCTCNTYMQTSRRNLLTFFLQKRMLSILQQCMKHCTHINYKSMCQICMTNLNTSKRGHEIGFSMANHAIYRVAYNAIYYNLITTNKNCTENVQCHFCKYCWQILPLPTFVYRPIGHRYQTIILKEPNIR